MLYDAFEIIWHWFRYEFIFIRGAIHFHGSAKLKSDSNLSELIYIVLAGYKDSESLKNKNRIFTKIKNFMLQFFVAYKLKRKYSDIRTIWSQRVI